MNLENVALKFAALGSGLHADPVSQEATLNTYASNEERLTGSRVDRDGVFLPLTQSLTFYHELLFPTSSHKFCRNCLAVSVR